MTITPPPQLAPEALAADAVRTVLRTQWDGVTALRLDSPPGAGKTGVVERLAIQALALLKERCMVVTQTNEQAFDLGRRLAQHFPRYRFTLFVRRDLAIPDTLRALTNLRVARQTRDIPSHGPCVVVANAARWSWVEAQALQPFDCQIIDEAFQLPDYRFQQIAGLAHRLVLVGDPGQLAPVVSCEIERWRCDPAGPHIACPRALVARHPGLLRLSLPVSRRLVPDTIRFVQPAFYPDLPFTAVSAPGVRRLKTGVDGATPLDQSMNLLERGASLVQVELPARITGELDEELADTMVAWLEQLLRRQVAVCEEGSVHALAPVMIGVVCAHVSQVNAVRQRLPRHLEDVLVETSDRFQGLERPITVVYHPLSGRVDVSEFHLDIGRLCVMLSRHRIACVVMARHGIEAILRRYVPKGDRVLGIDEDGEFEGWHTHLTLLQALRRHGRVLRLM